MYDFCRLTNVDSWICSPGESSDDQFFELTTQEQISGQDRNFTGSDARERLRRALPQAPNSNIAVYDNTAQTLMSDTSPYQEISEVFGNSRTNVDLHSEQGSEHRSRVRTTEGTFLLKSTKLST